jgi:hypothetical protein
MEGTVGTFSITKVTGVPPEAVTSGGHVQPSGNGYVVVVTTGSTEQQQPTRARHLRLVRD